MAQEACTHKLALSIALSILFATERKKKWLSIFKVFFFTLKKVLVWFLFFFPLKEKGACLRQFSAERQTALENGDYFTTPTDPVWSPSCEGSICFRWMSNGHQKTSSCHLGHRRWSSGVVGGRVRLQRYHFSLESDHGIYV